MVRVLAVSDVVDEALWADVSPARGAGLILACGDLPFEYLGRLMNALDVPLVFVPGNHDPDVSGYRTSRAGLWLRAGLPARPPWPDGALNADGRVVDVAGLRIAGLGGCRRYSEGPNQYTDWQQGWRARKLAARARLGQRFWPPAHWPGDGGRPAGVSRGASDPGARGVGFPPEQTPPGDGGRPAGVSRGASDPGGLRGVVPPGQHRHGLVDVLLTHAPPRGVGDGPDPPHQGFPALNALVRQLRPALLLHGHVDPTPGGPDGRPLGSTIVVNVTGRRLLDIEPGGALAGDPAGDPAGLAQPGTAWAGDAGQLRGVVAGEHHSTRRRRAG